MALEEKDREEIEQIAEGARKRARTCPLCKTEDSVFRSKCGSCGAICKDGEWALPKAPEPKAPEPKAPEPKAPEVMPPPDDSWDPLKIEW